TRSSRSPSARAWSMARRQPPGATNRNSPSSTAARHRADNSSVTMAGSAVVIQVLQELVVLVPDDHALTLVAFIPVSLQAALEREEARVTPRRLGIQCRGAGIALTAQALGITLGLGDDHRLLLVRLRAYRLRLLGALGAQCAGHLVALRAHATVDV